MSGFETKMLLKYVVLQIKLFVYSQIQARNLYIRMPMNNKLQNNTGNICFPHTYSIASAAQILQ
jgi:hypothetical protein